MKTKWIYNFSEGKSAMKDLLGGKGANLGEMTALGIPVPPGFIITTETCDYFLSHNSDYPENFWDAFENYLHELEQASGRVLGSAENPLLVSVRSGASVSMPGMMDTVLNLGLNDDTVRGLAAKTGDERFSFDAYRRLLQMFGNVVLQIDHNKFEHELEAVKEAGSVHQDTEMTASHLKDLVARYQLVIKNETGSEFPQNPREQLKLAIEAVFNSWNNKRAITYRRINKIHDLKGTAVTIQAMVFGNLGDSSGTGVAFTRNPSTGQKEFYGEFLQNAQGEDVVAGIRTPKKLSEMKDVMPEAYAQLDALQARLESHYRDMQDIEFTIEEGKLYLLQTRNGKRTAAAALKIATDMVSEGALTKEEALMQINADQLDKLLHPSIDPSSSLQVIAKGLAASPGAACGRVVFSADDAVEWVERGESVVLVRKETSPDDIHGMHVAEGILTSQGGMTSHAALVCRGMGKSCVAGCQDIKVDYPKKKFSCGVVEISEGDFISLNGSTGEVLLGQAKLVAPALSEEFRTIMEWADEVRTLKVRTNADTPKDAKAALRFGAEGIGLCRTEHMFFDEDRIPKVQELIISKDADARKKACDQLLPLQKKDFLEIFEVMDGLPCTIRLLDPPLHEFLPHEEKQQEELAARLGLPASEVKQKVDSLKEINPMLGHRGCRLGITFPMIYEMQVRAILEAAIEATGKGIKVYPEIEVPLIATVEELKEVKKTINSVIAELEQRITFELKVGTMMEVPRACLRADSIAEEADFFSFGTNDLTQLTFGYSRDDAGKFLQYYIENGVLTKDPTESLDKTGVGDLMRICVERGRSVKPDLEIGICGEHGGDPKSVKFCHEIGLNYVSCSPFRVPVARLAAAQAAIESR